MPRIQLYEQFVSFPYLDLRQQQVFGDDQRQIQLYQEYLQKGALAERRQKHVSGVKRRWVYHHLPYANALVHCTFDPMHCIGNIADLVLNIISGDKCNSAADVQLAAVQHMHPEWHMNESASATRKMPWQLLGDRDGAVVMEQRLSCLNIPRGYSNNYSIPKMTSERGNLSTHQRIVIFTTFFKLLSHQLLHTSYRTLFSQLSDDIVCVLSPTFEAESLPHVQEKVCETVALMEGMLPESAFTFIVHELLDIVAALERFGPIRSWWMFHYERVNRTIKTLAPAGGRSNDSTVIDRYDALEFSAFQQYDRAVDILPDSEIDNNIWGAGHDYSEHIVFSSPQQRRWSEENLSKLLRAALNSWRNRTSDSDHHRFQRLTFLLSLKPPRTTIFEWAQQCIVEQKDGAVEFLQICTKLSSLPIYLHAETQGISIYCNDADMGITSLTLLQSMKTSWRYCSSWVLFVDNRRADAREHFASANFFVRVPTIVGLPKLDFVFAQIWPTVLLGAEKACVGTSYPAIDLSQCTRSGCIDVISCTNLLPTAVASALLSAHPRSNMTVRSLNDLDATAQQEITHVALLPLHPWKLNEARSIKTACPTVRVELTWRQVKSIAATDGLQFLTDSITALAQFESRADPEGLVVAFKYNQGWALGALQSVVKSKADKRAGLTHLVRFDDGLFPVALEEEKAFNGDTHPRPPVQVSSWCLCQSAPV